MIGYGICGSFCTHARSIEALKKLAMKYDVIPVLTPAVTETDTRFGKAADFVESVETACARKAIMTVKDAEPLGPAVPLDCFVISPCTGNTLAKIACGITDTSVTMAAKAHLRCGGRLLIALASNDALSSNLQNIAKLLNKKNVYFVPMRQDDPVLKPHSLVADFSLVDACVELAFESVQARPLFI